MNETDRSIVPNSMICRPIDTYEEIFEFINDPPAWRTLCIELQPHSERAIRNTHARDADDVSLERPVTYCHFDPDESEIDLVEVSELPRTLVCHDMANGYHDDSIVDGTGNHAAYTFYNWAAVDTFCYFSHRLVTVPPLGWINVAHAHGARVIGTLITEWAPGTVFWERVLSSERAMSEMASALTAVAAALRFDGWLLNVENKVSDPERLIEFVRMLHETLHATLPHAQLIWYDSVTAQGHLAWQNQLNEHNRAFFDACDGLFTNYSWRVEQLAASAAAAGARRRDVFVGLDVWGRNFHGGGQFNTQQALRAAHAQGCSVAIFAPAWTHEAMSDHERQGADSNAVLMGDDLTRYERFLLRDKALWDSLWPFLNTRLPRTLPFQTSFCRGQGLKRCLYGEVLCPVPWYNLRHMQYQPNAAHGPHGYLLSTQQTLIAASHHAVSGSKGGILKIRQSLYNLDNNNKASEHSLSQKSEKPNDEQEPIDENEETVSKKTDEVTESKPKIKRKIMEVFQNCCKKTRQDEVETEKSENALGQSTSRIDSSGKSMAQLSVVINLDKSSLTRLMLAYVAEERDCLQLYLDDSFTGGSCLKVNPSDTVSEQHRTIRLFHTDFSCEDSLIACVVTKVLPEHDKQYLNVLLLGEDDKGQRIRVTLIGRSMPQMKILEGSPVLNIAPLNRTDPAFREMQKYLLLNEAGFYVPVENSFGWNVGYYEVPCGGGLRVRSVGCRTGLPRGALLLGHFGLCARACHASASPLLEVGRQLSKFVSCLEPHGTTAQHLRFRSTP